MQLATTRRAATPDRARAATFWHNHALALLLYAGLSLALSWPTVRDFTTRLTSDGIDARHNLWIFWHTREALLGRQPLYDAPLLFFPRGITLLVHGVGPLTSLFALPFWPLGPAAAYNGAFLISFWLSGYCTYLLARTLGFDRAVALFAGMMVMASPMVLAGLQIHVTKVFVGGLALTLLALHRALDPEQSAWWALGTGVAMLLVLLHNGYQFIFAALAIGFFVLAALLTTRGHERWRVLRRGLLIGLATLILTGPLLVAIVRAADTPGIVVDVNQDSFTAPDLIQYLLPPSISWVFGPWTQRVMHRLARETILNEETAVSLSLAGLALCLPVLLRRGRAGRTWLVLTALCVLFSCGPLVRVAGKTRFTEYDLPIILPYAFLTGLPGLDFMRSPGRFMELGGIALAITAAYGLAWLRQRLPRLRGEIVVVAALLVLVETWPRPFPQEILPPVPRFYQQIAADPTEYGVFDLPFKSSGSRGWNWTTAYAASYYQMFQMTHRKGIASGYISRTYGEHPVFAEMMTDDVSKLLLDGRPAVDLNFRAQLARNNYRYVVLHKTLFDVPGKPPGKAIASSEALLATAFAHEAPIVDDALVRVYQVSPYTPTVELHWGTGWRAPEKSWRWAASPATLVVDAPRAQAATLVITPAALHDPRAPEGLGSQGVLKLAVGAAPPVSVPIMVDQPARVPVTLGAGRQTITLALEAGNFRPSDYGQKDKSTLSFAVRAIDLQTGAPTRP